MSDGVYIGQARRRARRESRLVKSLCFDAAAPKMRTAGLRFVLFCVVVSVVACRVLT